MAQALAPNKLIVLAGVATMFAQAISMSAGNYLSVKSEKEYFSVKSKSRDYGKAYIAVKNPVISSLIMAISVMFGAAIPLMVFLFWESSNGIIPAIFITLASLFVVGGMKTKLTQKNWLKSGLEMAIVGGIAAVAGYFVGSLFA